jgi:hypothetical protein
MSSLFGSTGAHRRHGACSSSAWRSRPSKWSPRPMPNGSHTSPWGGESNGYPGFEFLTRRLQKPDLKEFGIRIYETHSGIRLILEGKAMDPKSRESKHLLRSFNADRLYATLCRKQNCCRARLTPKPYRIKMKPIRLRYPYEEKNRDHVEAWIREYHSKSERFSSCRLVKTLGRASLSPMVPYHDERTRARSNLPLA